MRHAHALAILVLAILVAAAGVCSPSFAQTAVRARARPQGAPVVDIPVAAAPAAARGATVFDRLTLRGLPRRFDAAPACRSHCTAERVACEAVDDACASEWTACLRRCTAA